MCYLCRRRGLLLPPNPNPCSVPWVRWGLMTWVAGEKWAPSRLFGQLGSPWWKSPVHVWEYSGGAVTWASWGDSFSGVLPGGQASRALNLPEAEPPGGPHHPGAPTTPKLWDGWGTALAINGHHPFLIRKITRGMVSESQTQVNLNNIPGEIQSLKTETPTRATAPARLAGKCAAAEFI